MPRTAVTLAKTHEGKWVMLADPGVSLIEQNKSVREFVGRKSHDKYGLIYIQESDGHARQIRLNTPGDQKKHDDLRKKEMDSAVAAGLEEQKNIKAKLLKSQNERIEQHNAEIDRLNAAVVKESAPRKPKDDESPDTSNTSPLPNLVDPASGLRVNGPSKEEYVKAGFKAENYPPEGYAPLPLNPAQQAIYDAAVKVLGSSPAKEENAGGSPATTAK